MDKEKTHNIYEVMQNLTGITKDEQIKIMEGVRENRRKLDSCELHDFSIEVPKPRRCFPDYKCSNCGGIVDKHEKDWYEKGFEHAMKMGGTHDKDKE